MGRIKLLGLFAGALLLTEGASAQSGGQYDWQTGTVTTWSAKPDGSLQTRSTNWRYGMDGQTTYRPDGSSQGTDRGGNRWNHNAQSGYYFDFSTGTSCFQKAGVDTC